MNGTSIPALGAEAGCSLARTGSVLASALASAGFGGLSVRGAGVVASGTTTTLSVTGSLSALAGSNRAVMVETICGTPPVGFTGMPTSSAKCSKNDSTTALIRRIQARVETGSNAGIWARNKFSAASIRIAIAPDFTRTAALFGGGEALLDHFAGNCTRHALAVDEEHGRRAGDIFLLAERERLVDRRGVAGAGGGRCNIVDELIVPRLDLVF